MNERDVLLLSAVDLDYASARLWQGCTAEALALIEHAPVYTMGARGGRASLRMPVGALPAPLVDTDRGGDVTWHGPGQLVAYPILDLGARGMRASEYIEALEGMLLDTLAAFGIDAALVEGRRGVWVGDDKIAALGIRVQGGVSLHGVALNVAPDLAWFDAIVPCGLEDAGVTSMSRVLGRPLSVDDARVAMRDAFARRFASRLVDLPPSPLAGEARGGGSSPRTAVLA